MKDIACGSSHSAAITSSGELYSWGCRDSVKVSRVACGSSHSICWTIQDSQTSNVYEPVLFANSKDPLGTHFIGLKDLNNDDSNLSCEGSSPGGRKAARLSLSRILLSLESNASKQKSLQHTLNGLQIM